MKTLIKRLEWLGGWDDVRIELARYGNGTTAVQLIAMMPEGYEDVLSIASTNLEGYGIVPDEDGAFFIKDYSEHKGLAAALEKAGAVERTGRLITIKFPTYSAEYEQYRFAGAHRDEYLNDWAPKEEA